MDAMCINSCDDGGQVVLEVWKGERKIVAYTEKVEYAFKVRGLHDPIEETTDLVEAWEWLNDKQRPLSSQ